MILSAMIIFATATTMILGVFYLHSKTTGRFFTRQTIQWIFCAEIAAVLAVSAFLYVPTRVPSLATILVCRYRDDWTTHHNTKMATLASEIIRSTPETDRRFGWTHDIRGEMNLRERKFDEAIADFDVALHFDVFPMFCYASRGEAKMGKGDFSGALEDFDKAVGLNRHNEGVYYYNRGFAYEKLGNIEAALADYDKAIAWAEQFLENQPIVSNTARPGYDDESRRRIHDRWRFGYVISFEELVEIRERLAAESGQ
jgi:tetratricopeptide (TPR) repeat protein